MQADNRDTLNARFPIGQSICGLCHFVIHDKDSTPILQIFPDEKLFLRECDYGHRFEIARIGEEDIKVKYYKRNDVEEPIFVHWPKYEINCDNAFRHISYLANDTFGLDTKQVNLVVRFYDKSQCQQFVEMHEFGKVLGGYAGVKFGRRKDENRPT